jgi:hypothetical protein
MTVIRAASRHTVVGINVKKSKTLKQRNFAIIFWDIFGIYSLLDFFLDFCARLHLLLWAPVLCRYYYIRNNYYICTKIQDTHRDMIYGIQCYCFVLFKKILILFSILELLLDFHM